MNGMENVKFIKFLEPSKIFTFDNGFQSVTVLCMPVYCQHQDCAERCKFILIVILISPINLLAKDFPLHCLCLPLY